MSDSITVDQSLDYAPKEFSSGSYVLRQVNPENGQPTLASQSTINTDFLLPNTVYNLQRSYLNWNVLLNKGAGTVANVVNAFHSGFLAQIDGIVLSTASGIRLVEMNNLPEYTKLAWRVETDLEEFLSFPCHSVGVTEIDVPTVTQPGRLFNRIRGAADPGTSFVQNAAGSLHVANEAGTLQVAASDDYTAVANYVAASLATTAGGAGTVAVRCQLPLKMIYGSLLALDKDLYFNEQLRLTIRWNAGNKFGMLMAGSGGPPITALDRTTASTDLSETPSIYNVSLRVAVQTNDAVAQGLKNKILSEAGIKINVPFTHMQKFVGSAAASDTSTAIRKFNRGHGKKLLRVLSGLFSANQTGGRYCNMYNAGTVSAGAVIYPKWTTYRTMLDSKPIQDDNLSMIDHSAYQYSAEKLQGSVIKDVRDWSQVPTIIEDFSGVRYSKDYPQYDHIASGLDLSTEREFALQYTNSPQNATALNVMMFAVCQRELSINNSGIQFM